MKKFLSLLLAIIMVIGMFPMTAFAEETNILEETVIVDEAETSDEAEIADETEVSDETAVTDGNLALEPVSVSDEANTLGEDGDEKKIYEVIVKVAPSEANVKFYSDSDAANEITEGITDNGIVGGYHQYTFVTEEGMYSYRAWEGEQFLGGMEFKVPIDDEYASDGSLMGKGQVLTLRRANFLTTSEHITETDDFTLHLIPQDLKEAVNGTSYINVNGNVVCPVMVNAGGNALTYNMLVDINGELGETYAVAPQQHLTFNPGTTTETREFAVSAVTWFTITAPAEAKVQMFQQKNNYNVAEILASKSETLEDGTVKTYFATSGGSSLTYRVSMDGKITRAGFASSSYKNKVFTFKENEDPKTTRTTAVRIENSSVLNINPQNNLKMAVGETFRLRSFRAGWQIINTDTANIMIEPDFHYNIISGAEHITMTPVTDKTTGNAGSGENSNWMDITAVSEGTVILEVSYDAIQIDGDTSYPGIFGATENDGKSVVVINVGEDKTNTLEITPVHGTHSKYKWESDFDRVYFLGETADFNFTANMDGTVELSTDLGKSWTTVSKNGEGVYEAKGLVHGNNILRVTEGDNVQYQIVRASKIVATIVNMTRTGDDTIIVGDKVRVLFSNIYTPVPKMSGIYNPGFGSGHKVVYTVPEGISASASGSQYGFAEDNQLELVFNETGTFTLTGGYIPSKVLGDALGDHRKLTDAGRGTNFNAGDASSNRCVLPDLTFNVIEMPVVKVTVVSDPEGAVIEVFDKSGNVMEANEDGTYSLEYGTYNYTATMEGFVPEKGKFTVGEGEDSTGEKTVVITMRAVGGAIWDGTTKTEPAKDENGVYLIETGAELAWFASNHNNAGAKLMADISLGGYSVTISSYTGTFDGNGHYITDFNGSKSLFQQPREAVIKNLGVSGSIQGSTGWYSPQGGIVSNYYGSNTNITIDSCVSRVNVSGEGPTGGIIGMAESGSFIYMPRVTNCYNAGTVTSTNGIGYTGGIGGIQDSNPIQYVENCYNIGNVAGTQGYGIERTGRGTNRNNYTLLGSAANAGGTALTSDAMKNIASSLGDAFMDNPTNYNDGYPILKWEEPRARAVLQEDCIAELIAYESGEFFTEIALEKLEKAIEDGKKAIMEAGSFAEVEEALEAAKAVIDAIDPFEGTSAMPGDINADGSVNVIDILHLRKYLADNNYHINTENADLNYDGKVNVLDLLALRKRLAG